MDQPGPPDALSALSSLQQATSPAALDTALVEALHLYGLEWFGFGRVRRQAGRDIETFFRSNHPLVADRRHFLPNGPYRQSAICPGGHDWQQPRLLTEVEKTWKDDPARDAQFEYERSLGLHSSIYLPIYCTSSQRVGMGVGLFSGAGHIRIAHIFEAHLGALYLLSCAYTNLLAMMIAEEGEGERAGEIDGPGLAGMISDFMAEKGANTTEGKNTASPLTQREVECLVLAARGRTYEEIGATLGISRRTVSFHLHNAMTKLDAVSTVQAVAIALDRHLIPRA